MARNLEKYLLNIIFHICLYNMGESEMQHQVVIKVFSASIVTHGSSAIGFPKIWQQVVLKIRQIFKMGPAK